VRGRPFYERLAAAAFVFIPASYLVLLAVLRAFGGTVPNGVVTMLVVASVPALLAAALIAVSPRLLPVSFALALVVLLVGAPAGSFGLGHIDSFFDFMTPVVTIAGALTAAASCIAAFVLRRRGGSDGRHVVGRAMARVVLGALILLAVVSGVLTRAHGTGADVPAGATLVDLRASGFVPSHLELRRGRVRLYLRNDDAFAHTFTADAIGVDYYVAPLRGRLVEFDVPAASPPRFEFTCSVLGHDAMMGTISVR
jgi:hypothetical protein